MPITWLIVLFAFGFWKRKRRVGAWSLGIGLLLLLLLSNSYLQSKWMKSWEVPPIALADLPRQKYDLCIVLGGVTEGFRKPDDRVYTHKGADRVLHAALLYQKGLVRKILVTGSFYRLDGNKASEAENMKQLLMLSGVPERDILKEEDSRNTRENALFSAALLEERSISPQSVILVTSAFHMRRSLGCFRKVGIDPQPFSTDFYSDATEPQFTDLIFPAEDALAYNARLVRELLGYLVYTVMGYI